MDNVTQTMLLLLWQLEESTVLLCYVKVMPSPLHPVKGRAKLNCGKFFKYPNSTPQMSTGSESKSNREVRTYVRNARTEWSYVLHLDWV